MYIINTRNMYAKAVMTKAELKLRADPRIASISDERSFSDRGDDTDGIWCYLYLPAIGTRPVS